MPQTMTNVDKFLSLVPVENFDRYSADIAGESFFGFPIGPILEAEEKLRRADANAIGYFSMEYGLSTNTYNAFQNAAPVNPRNISNDHHIFSNLRAIDYYLTIKADHLLDLPIYSGGLGVLAGDTLKSAADRRVPLAAVGVLWNKGYFKQRFWFKDGQIPDETNWDPASFPGLAPLKTHVEIVLKNEILRLKLWKYFVFSFDRQSVVPLILLDSNLPENKPFSQSLTSQLYKSDNAEWKLLQRVILGIGGVKALEALGYSIAKYHLNEGHAALAFVEKAKGLGDSEVARLRKRFAYTCHTPVAAGHDRFQKKTAQDILPDEDFQIMKRFGQDPEAADLLNLTHFCLSACESVNAVAKKHGEITRLQFPSFAERIRSVTNGVHVPTWLSAPMAELLDGFREKMGDWRKNSETLKGAASLASDPAFRRGLWDAHQKNKRALGSLLTKWRIEEGVFTLAWARRIAAYKRPSLILQKPDRLLEIAKRVGPIQILFAGKAHPKDDLGFTYVNEMLSAVDALEPQRDLVRVVMLENYDTYFARILTSGVDVWLNNPLPPFEASGTSGMKAILNGVLQLSTLDGWVVEAAEQNIGWIFGWRHEGAAVGDERNLRLSEDADSLYDTLEKAVSLYYETNRRDGARIESEWITKMVNAVAAGGFFNTDRMTREYAERIWQLM